MEDKYCGHCPSFEFVGLDFDCYAYGYCNAKLGDAPHNQCYIVYAREVDCEIKPYYFRREEI